MAGERVAVWAPSRPESLLLTYAAARAALVLVPVNPALRAAEVLHILSQSGAAGVFLLGSGLSGAAWSMGALTVFRLIQGFGGGLLQPVGQSVLARAAGPRRMGRVMSISAVPLLVFRSRSANRPACSSWNSPERNCSVEPPIE